MYTFPIIATVTICASFAILRATFDELREPPQAGVVAEASEGLLALPSDYIPPRD